MAGLGRGSNRILRDLHTSIPVGNGKLSDLTQALLEAEGIKEKGLLTIVTTPVFLLGQRSLSRLNDNRR